MKQIKFRISEEEEKAVARKMNSFKHDGSISSFAKKLLLKGGSYKANKMFLEKMYHYEFINEELDNILEAEPTMLRVEVANFKQKLAERLQDIFEEQ